MHGVHNLLKMKIPDHIAIIMDGNGRWAKKHRLPRAQGHRMGVKALERTVEAAIDLGVKYLTVYAFSIDNWSRSDSEVNSLMNLMREFLNNQKKNIKDKDARLRFIGRIHDLPEDIISKIKDLTYETKDNERFTLVLALNYGGRAEILDVCRDLGKDVLENRIKPEDIDEDYFSKYLYTQDIPDPDLLIRTSGEMRISNFLLWQLSYTELWFTEVYWPDFKKKDLVEAINEFSRRERRYGGRLKK